MARYAPVQIYGFARKAGFTPDQAATMTAVALAETGGNSRAHNPYGEDSRGLWQINARAHPDLAARYDLYDPVQNARAAYEVSHGGRDFTPWTVTHGGTRARYVDFRDEAQAAAVSYGDGGARGIWTGTSGYGHPLSATDGGPVPETGTANGPAGSSLQSDSPVQRFLSAALAQAGDRYVFGAEAAPDDPDPGTFDCSELVEWASGQVGVKVPDGASAQYLWAKQRGFLIPVEEAARTPGALLFHFSSEPRPGGGRPSSAHVAISLGDGEKTIEARNSRYPVGSYDIGHRFNYAAVIPGISDPASLTGVGSLDLSGRPAAPMQPATAVAPVSAPAPNLGGPDSDGDGVTDRREQQDGLNAHAADTDSDGLPDGLEVTHGSDPRLADGDGDNVLDAFEFAEGSNPLDPDSNDDGHLDGSEPASWVDTDRDRIDDDLERLLQLDPKLEDSDLDGYVDGLEYSSGSRPLDPMDHPLASLADALVDDPTS